jgi:hypothetical protein
MAENKSLLDRISALEGEGWRGGGEGGRVVDSVPFTIQLETSLCAALPLSILCLFLCNPAGHE